MQDCPAISHATQIKQLLPSAPKVGDIQIPPQYLLEWHDGSVLESVINLELRKVRRSEIAQMPSLNLKV